MISSGQVDKITEIFDAIPINNQNVVNGNNAWMRKADSEYNILNRQMN